MSDKNAKNDLRAALHNRGILRTTVQCRQTMSQDKAMARSGGKPFLPRSVGIKLSRMDG
jgi:hypothetical protein